MEKRQELLVDHERQKRPYRKKDAAFWFEGGKSAVAQKIPRLEQEQPETPLLP